MQDFREIFSDKDHYEKPFPLTLADVTEKAIADTEKAIGYTIPPSYLEFVRTQNGGHVKKELDSWVNTFYGITEDLDQAYSLASLWSLLVNEWEYPSDIGFPFADTQSGGHDAYFFDFRKIDEKGEPAVIRIDNELDNAQYHVAKNFNDFLSLVCLNGNLQGTRM